METVSFYSVNIATKNNKIKNISLKNRKVTKISLVGYVFGDQLHTKTDTQSPKHIDKLLQGTMNYNIVVTIQL